ncbi:hypothetical protein EG327_003932 [Venturia inaequalis]|uniref:Uncharacterized protein n=1 Tax=Venturia inaequalis TaxID=5025 RepID=A0A8H3ZEV7_VENIN|nr:hypothetical protein EG327_003932 [Venturia inaequalis]
MAEIRLYRTRRPRERAIIRSCLMDWTDWTKHGDGTGRASAGIPPIVGSPLMADASPTPQAQTSFQFIDVAQNESAEQRSRKRTIARSHVMKTVRRGQRKSTDVGVTSLAARRRSSHSSPEASAARSPRIRSYCEENEENPKIVARAGPGDAFSQQFQNNIRSSYTSGSSRMEADLSSNSVLSNSWTPFAFEMMNHNLKVIWPLFWPGTSSEKSNPMAMDWWDMYRSSPILFHASTHSAAAHLDSLRSSTSLTRTAEALEHKTAAIRLINEELSRLQKEGGIPSDDLMMAILSMTSEVDDELLVTNAVLSSRPRTFFKPPLMSAQWERQFSNIRSAKVHDVALYTLLKMRGGSIGNVQNICLAKSISHHELLAAALDLRKPNFAFFEAPDIIALSENPMLNILINPVDEQRGWALPSLLNHGITEMALRVMLDLQYVSVIIEAYTHGALQNPNILALTSKRNSVHHALFSLPTLDEMEVLTIDQRAMYESCRVAAIIYDLSIIFPVPPSTGVVAKLVTMSQSILETTRLEFMLGACARICIWVLFMAGCAAESMSDERAWFVGRLRMVLVSEAIFEWTIVRDVLNSYLWLSSAMDDAALKLWDEISVDR